MSIRGRNLHWDPHPEDDLSIGANILGSLMAQGIAPTWVETLKSEPSSLVLSCEIRYMSGWLPSIQRTLHPAPRIRRAMLVHVIRTESSDYN